jgi:hypothetical protein
MDPKQVNAANLYFMVTRCADELASFWVSKFFSFVFI